MHTGQHYDSNLSDVFFDELEIPRPDINLGVGSGTHGAQTGRMLEALEATLLREKPDWVLVYGDTNSTLAGALAAVKLQIPVAHVEAGLRSYNRRMPEEVNRVLTDHISNLLFAPTTIAVRNLEREGVSQERIHLTGDVMYDAALYYRERSDASSRVLEKLGLVGQTYALTTIHRAENTDDSERITAIVHGLIEVAQDLTVVMPLHPRTRRALTELGLLRVVLDKLTILEPVGYLDMVQLERNASVIVTDSGGVQKEAYFYRVPCVTLRDETEWIELVDAGWNRLLPPTDPKRIRDGVLGAVGRQGDPIDLYGAGNAAEKIVAILRSAVSSNDHEIDHL